MAPGPLGSIRVLLVEDQTMMVEGLEALLGSESDLSVVGTATTGASAVRLVLAAEPDVVVIGHRLPDTRGTDLARELRARLGDLAIVMLSALPEKFLLGQALEAGCSALVWKGRKAENLIEAVRAAAAGRSLLNVESARRLSRQQRLGEETGLSRREIEVLQCLCEGLTNGEIAERLFLSTNTVGNHLYRLMRKLGARSKLGALVVGLQLGLVVLPEYTAGPVGVFAPLH